VESKMKLIYIALLFTFLFSTVHASDDLTGSEIIQKVSDLMNQQSNYAKMTLTIITTSGKERRFVYESFSINKNEKSVIKYTAPARVKGQATLLLNNADDIWSYDPRTDRVRKLATHAKKQKMQGSDFTYEDMGSGNSYVTDFDAGRLGDEKMEGQNCYKISLQKNEKGNSNYAKIVMWVLKENFVPIVIDYYDKDEPTVCMKRLVQKEIISIDGIPTPMKIFMHNNLDDSDTKLELIECRYNIEIDKSRFAQRSFYR
jgi:outer membrane lipoprotein-sorting protein